MSRKRDKYKTKSNRAKKSLIVDSPFWKPIHLWSKGEKLSGIILAGFKLRLTSGEEMILNTNESLYSELSKYEPGDRIEITCIQSYISYTDPDTPNTPALFRVTKNLITRRK